MTPKLTPAQLAVIKRMKKGENLIQLSISQRWLLGAEYLRPQIPQALKMIGLIEETKPLSYTYQLSDKGRAIEQ